MFTFPISGVETYWWLPALVAMLVSAITSTGGLSGAFVLLPFQVSVLRFTGPAVSPTNLLFNIIAIPAGVWRFYREGRIVWPLAWVVIAGTLPGLLAGVYIRVKLLPDPRSFKLFVGAVLAYVAARLIQSLLARRRPVSQTNSQSSDFTISNAQLNWRSLSYCFVGQTHSAPTWGIVGLTAVVGIIGGTYGIGGGAIVAPFLVSVWRLPIHTVAGAALLSTFVTSIVGVLYYWLLAPLLIDSTFSTTPDWHLGLALGVGGAIGIYLGASLQKFLPGGLIKGVLAACLLFIAGKYAFDFFLG